MPAGDLRDFAVMLHSDYIVFVDESGDHNLTSINDRFPAFVLAFCVISFAAYNEVVAPAVRKLKFALFGHDCVVLHEHDIRKREGAYSAVSNEKRTELMQALSRIVREADMTIIAVAIDKKRHKAKYVRPIHPYDLAMRFGLERLNGYLYERGQHQKLTHVICEARGATEDRNLELEFRRVCDGLNQRGQRFCLDIVIASKKLNSEGLQLADLVARPIGLHVIRPDQPNQAWDVIESKLLTDRSGNYVGRGLKVFP
jgi:hypothetical protein